MMGGLWFSLAVGDRRKCDQGEYDAVKAEKGAKWAHVIFPDKNGTH